MAVIRRRTPDGVPAELRQDAPGGVAYEFYEGSEWSVTTDWGSECVETDEDSETSAAARAQAESCLPGVRSAQVNHRDRPYQTWVSGDPAGS